MSAEKAFVLGVLLTTIIAAVLHALKLRNVRRAYADAKRQETQFVIDEAEAIFQEIEQQKEKKLYSTLNIPDQYVREIFSLYDEYQKQPMNSDRTARYDLWDKVAKVFPAVKEGHWRLNVKVHPMRITVVELETRDCDED